MSFTVVDNLGNVRINKKNGQPMKDMPDDKLGIVKQKFAKELEEKTLRIVTDQDVHDDIQKNTPPKERFAETVFPNSTRFVRNGGDPKSLKNIAATAGDLATLIPRTIVGGLSYWKTPSNKHEKTLAEEVGTTSEDVKLDDDESFGGFNLGGRARKFVTSPEFAVGLATAPLSEVGYGAASLMNLGTKASKVAGLIGGAAYGAGLEGASQLMNPNQDGIDWEKIGSAAIGGGAFEGLGQVVRAAIAKIGYEQVKEIAAKAWLGGSTNRKLTDKEFEMFMRDPQNVRTLEIALNDGIRLKDQMLTVVGGRDVPIHRIENLAKKESKAFEDAFPADGKNFAPAPFESMELGASRDKAFKNYVSENVNNPEFGVYNDFKPVSPNERAKTLSPREFNANNFEGHVTHLKRFAEKMPETKSGIMTKTESDYIDYLEELFKREQNIVQGANNHAIPYEIDKSLEAKIRQQGSVSDAFNDALNALIHDYEVSSSQLSKKAGAEFSDIHSQLADAFAQAGDGRGSLVRKDYVGSTKELMQDLIGYTRGLAGKTNTNSVGNMYSASVDGAASKIRKEFIDPIQTKLRNKTHLDADDFEEFYFKAAEFNMVDVMRFLEDYAKKLGVTDAQIQVLRKEGRVPGQLHKLANGMRMDAPNNSNPFGRAVSLIDPRGVNATGVKAANFAKRNYQVGNWVNRSSNPNGRYNATTTLKPTIFNLGNRYFNQDEGK